MAQHNLRDINRRRNFLASVYERFTEGVRYARLERIEGITRGARVMRVAYSHQLRTRACLSELDRRIGL
jgi:hypothetical protein